MSTWVAGVETPVSVLDSLKTANTSYSYSGQLRGIMYDGSNMATINQYSSSVNFTVNFGSGTVTGGSIKAVSDLGNISSSLSGNMDTTKNLLQAAGTGDTAGHSASIVGKIYGPEAQQAAGVFKASNGAGLNAAGVFKASKQ
jgi:hypothetical protein